MATLQALRTENSQEYHTRVAEGLYRHYLRRSADPGGLAGNTAALAAGATAEQMAANLASSQEYFQVRGGGTNDGFLTAIYQDVLNRPIDSSSRAHFTQLLGNGITRHRLASIILGGNAYAKLAFSGDGKVLAVGLYDQMVRLYDPVTAKKLANLSGLEEQAGAQVTFAPGGKLLVTGHPLGTLRLWGLGAWKPSVSAGKEDALPPMKATFSAANRGRLLCVAIDRDERTVAAGFEDGSVMVWDVASGRATTLEGHKLPVRSAAFTSNGKKLLTGGGDWRKHERGGEVKVWDLATGKVSTNYPWNIGPVYAVAVSPDGKTHAAGGDNGMELWDAGTGKPRPLSWVPSGIYSIAFAPDSQTVAAGGFYRVVYLWDPFTGKEKGVLKKGHTEPIESICFHPDGQTLATGARDRTVKLWDLRNREPLATLQALGIENSQEYRTLVVQRLYRQYLRRSAEPAGLAGFTAALEAGAAAEELAASVAGSQEYFKVRGGGTNEGFLTALYQDLLNRPIDSSGRAHFTHLLDNGTPRTQLASMILGINEHFRTPSMAFSGHGNVLAVGLYNHMVKLYDPVTAKELTNLPGAEERAGGHVAFAPRGKLLVTGHAHGTLRLWDLGAWKPSAPAGKEEALPPMPTEPTILPEAPPIPVPKPNLGVRAPLEPKATFRAENPCGLLCLAISPEEKTVAAGFEDGNIVVWDVATGKATTLEGHKLHVRSAVFTPDGKKLLTGGGDWPKPERGGEVRMWDLVTGKVSIHYPWNRGPVFAVAVSPDGKTLAAGGPGGIELWDADTGKARPLPRGLRGVISIAFAPDSQSVAACGGGRPPLVHVWDPVTGKEKGTLKGHTEMIESLCFHPEGRALATGGRDGTVKLWDIRTQELQATLRLDGVVRVAFSGDGKVLAVATSSSRVKLCDPATAKELTDLLGQGTRVAFAPSGKLLATADQFGTVRLWDLSTWKPPLPAGKEDAAKTEVERLQGTWFRVSIVHGNERFGENPDDTITYSGNKFTLKESGAVTLTGTFEIVDATGEPKQMDLICTEGGHKGKRLRAIYKIEGDRLQTCTDDGTGHRPKEFSGAAGFYRDMKRKRP